MKYESPTSNSSKVLAYVKFSDMKVKGHSYKVKKFGMNRKDSSQGMYM